MVSNHLGDMYAIQKTNFKHRMLKYIYLEKTFRLSSKYFVKKNMNFQQKSESFGQIIHYNTNFYLYLYLFIYLHNLCIKLNFLKHF